MARNVDVNGTGTTSRILDVAERMLQVRGYNGFSYGDVAAELGITRAALHYHFKGKAELGQALIERYADPLRRRARRPRRHRARRRGQAARLRRPLHRRAQRRPDVPVRHARRRARTLPDPLQQAVCDFFAANTPGCAPCSSRAAPTAACAAPARRGHGVDGARHPGGRHADHPSGRRRRPLHRDDRSAARPAWCRPGPDNATAPLPRTEEGPVHGDSLESADVAGVIGRTRGTKSPRSSSVYRSAPSGRGGDLAQRLARAAGCRSGRSAGSR